LSRDGMFLRFDNRGSQRLITVSRFLNEQYDRPYSLPAQF